MGIAAISGFPILTMASRKALFALPTRAIRSSRTTSSLLAPLQHHRAESTASSTSALAYKALHRRVYPLPTSDAPPSWSAQAAVSNILYEGDYESHGGWLREEAIVMLRRFYVQENERAPEPRAKKDRVLKLEVEPIGTEKMGG